MKKLYILFISLFLSQQIFAYSINGIVKDNKGNGLAYSSILIKGTTKGTTCNAKGAYSLQLQKGMYTIICQHIGYKQIEKNIEIINNDVELNFELTPQEYTLTDVVVKANAEDPAYEIIRKAIKKREEHLNEIKKFECEVYIKGQMQLRDFPKKFMGNKVDFEDGDTSKKKMIYLSETVAKYTVERPNDEKIEIISTRVSGNSNSFGLSNPQIANFYENNLKFGSQLNPRGFISPIANNALNFYKYKFEGTFYENGKEISRIKVMPKRKYEPLFTGYISIIEDEWRIYSVQLYVLKEQQMQYLDTLQIEQLYMPVKKTWVVKQQIISPAGKIFGFDFFGSFVQVYDKVNVEPAIKKKFFNNIKYKFYDSANKKTKAYWDSIRPVPLLETEAKDYVKKDSLEQVRKSPHYLDSIDKAGNKVSIMNLLLTGKMFSKQSKKSSLYFPPSINGVNFNTVEGWNFNISPDYVKRWEGRKSLSLSPNIRYGFTNKHLNIHLTTQYNFGKKYRSNINFSFGKRVYQFFHDEPITERDNTYRSLWQSLNYMKIYEAKFAKINFTKSMGSGIVLNFSANYEDRLPLENATDLKVFKNVDGRYFTPNFPTEILSSNIPNHKALIAGFRITYRPKTYYAELPDRMLSLGSKYPTFSLSLQQGIPNILSSNVNYTKWQFTINDNVDLKLGGRFDYKITSGGFLNQSSLYAPDNKHFMGNLSSFAAPYLNSFQLIPYYHYSNTAKFYSTAHLEYHLNGLLSNKIPGFKKLNWFFVIGSNSLFIEPKINYHEVFFSVENIFKIIRVDFVKGFNNKDFSNFGIRFSLPAFISGTRDN